MKRALASVAGIWMVVAMLSAQGPAASASRSAHVGPVSPAAAGDPAARASRIDRRAPAAQAAQAAAATKAVATEPAAVVKQYCATCHSTRMKSGGLVLEGLDPSKVSGHIVEWEKVVRKVKTGMMPPNGAPRPAREVLDGLVLTLEATLDRAAVPNASLEAPALRRLNRTEYGNAIRDVLALDVDVAPLLPADSSSEGFDNIADALGVSPSLIQGYVSAAMKISRQAVGDRTLTQSTVTYSAPPGYVQNKHIDGLPLGTRGGMLVRHTFPLDAEYEIVVGGGGPGGRGGGAGGGIDVTLDGEQLTVQNPRRFRIALSAGPHVIGVALLDRQRSPGLDEIYSDFREDANFQVAGGVNNVAITGPLNPKGPGDTPSRRRLFVCRPAAAAEEAACARQILSTVARRAYRGPVTPQELATLMEFYEQGRRDGDFETGIQQGLARVLVSPRFIYRAEQEPASVAPGAAYAISDLELASRLSFLLWSSVPDDALLDLAEQNRLRAPGVLQQQVRRMLDDPRSEAIIKNFAGQWLYLRELDHFQSDAKNFDDNLRRAFKRETELLFESIVREDRSLIELLDADYTFVDERLAAHYGIANVRGSHFRRVLLPADSPRRGLLGHGAILTVTSSATRTSPVIRGKWVLENILGAPPPEPPPGVETNLDVDADAVKVTTVRQRLELHRGNPVCASCHNIIDPLGFALENFDMVGTWRETESGVPVDAKGRLADGTPLSGPADLRKALLSRSDAFVTVAAEKLMTYGLGRPMEAVDMPAIRAIVRRASAANNRFSALLVGVIESDAFQKRVKKGPEPARVRAE